MRVRVQDVVKITGKCLLLVYITIARLETTTVICTY